MATEWEREAKIQAEISDWAGGVVLGSSFEIGEHQR